MKNPVLPADVFRSDAADRADVAIVVGSSDPELLQHRISSAVTLFKAKRVRTLLLSGDGRSKNSEGRTEADRMREIAVKAGVPETAIVLEDASKEAQQLTAQLTAHEVCHRGHIRLAHAANVHHSAKAPAAQHYALVLSCDRRLHRQKLADHSAKPSDRDQRTTLDRDAAEDRVFAAVRHESGSSSHAPRADHTSSKRQRVGCLPHTVDAFTPSREWVQRPKPQKSKERSERPTRWRFELVWEFCVPRSAGVAILSGGYSPSTDDRCR